MKCDFPIATKAVLTARQPSQGTEPIGGPPSCAFCIPAGPDEMVEVFSKRAVKYSLEPVTVSGTFAVLRNDPGGLFYRLADAVSVSAEGGRH